MIIKKIFNNNAVVAKDCANREIVAMGCGIAFKMNIGEVLDESKIEKTFILKEKEASERFKLLLEDVDSEIVSLCYDIIEYAKNLLDVELNDYVYVTLTDHINNAIKLQKDGFNTSNVIIWEIRKFYSKEYAIGIKALEFIQEELGVELPEDEAGNIALHLINAQVNKRCNIKKDVSKQTKMINDILNIVRYTYNINLDENSLSYERFITHLRFFFQRLNKKEFYCDEENEEDSEDFLLNQVKKKYKNAYSCMLKVEKYLEIELSNEEKLYLTLHIQKVTIN
ncbi:PRD domain-containing protein [Clostridium sp. NSJ-6]|uniref:PRD domain-containing protein n=1 Tax=Clostridium hominis TaxID=2763036 RepID=A0ABR7D8R7_9CLOT|nr:PRD domain-containing protein [Clostridium hominis]MBC5627779.1 PRD domain-containing protein [Clostridium hominis]MDU2672952.1 PRD domain-containing protein [Clostridium sp.]